MEQQYKFNLYIGLLKSDMKTELNKDMVLKIVSDKLINIGVLGFNSDFITGSWNGKTEPCLKVSFINTFGFHVKDLIIVLESLKIELEQESILVEQESVLYNFI